MAIDYTAYPTVSDVTDLLASANITLGAGVTADIKQLKIDAAIAELEHATGRKFAPGATGEIRYYNGSGTGEIVIDEYVSIESIEFLQLPGVSTITITNWAEVEHPPFPKTHVQILRGPSNMSVGWWTKFPQGRSNIKVTAQFGFEEVPAAIWSAVASKAAANLADAARMSGNGMLTGLKDLDQDFTWSSEQIGTLAGWKSEFDAAKALYRRPLRTFLQRTRPVLV